MKGSQNDKIRAVMQGSYANYVSETSYARLQGALLGGIGGILLGGVLRQNALMVGLIGAVIGFVVSNKTEI